jgi:hypothetical protein
MSYTLIIPPLGLVDIDKVLWILRRDGRLEFDSQTSSWWLRASGIETTISTDTIIEAVRCLPPRKRKRTRAEAMRIARQETTLTKLGFTALEAAALRRASTALHRWALRECNGEIERDADGAPWAVVGHRPISVIRDKEAGAVKRIDAVLAARNARSAHDALSWYHQGDPRGRAVYILRPGDVPEGAPAHAHYNWGIAVY